MLWPAAVFISKASPKKNPALFKWLLKHGCCPWILMAISLIVQTREGEISKLLTPLRISSGHNMSLSCQLMTFVYPWVCRAARCVTLLKKGNSLHAKESLVTVWITWGLVAYFYGRWRTGRHDWEWTCPCMFMEFCHARFLFSFFFKAGSAQPTRLMSSWSKALQRCMLTSAIYETVRQAPQQRGCDWFI